MIGSEVEANSSGVAGYDPTAAEHWSETRCVHSAQRDREEEAHSHIPLAKSGWMAPFQIHGWGITPQGVAPEDSNRIDGQKREHWLYHLQKDGAVKS